MKLVNTHYGIWSVGRSATNRDIPGWWVGKPVNRIRFVTILANLKRSAP